MAAPSTNVAWHISQIDAIIALAPRTSGLKLVARPHSRKFWCPHKAGGSISLSTVKSAALESIHTVPPRSCSGSAGSSSEGRECPAPTARARLKAEGSGQAEGSPALARLLGSDSRPSTYQYLRRGRREPLAFTL